MTEPRAEGPPDPRTVPLSRIVLAWAPKAEDLQVHICQVVLPGGAKALDVREYVPSLGIYGRGTTLQWNSETKLALATAAEGMERGDLTASNRLGGLL